MKEILVLVEHRQGVLREVSFELLSLARSLAAGGQATVSALVLAGQASAFAAQLAPKADRVLVVHAAELADYNADSYLAALETLLGERKPWLILVAHTATGMDLAPALGVRLGLPVATDCLRARLDGAGLAAVRQMYGGKLWAHLELKAAAATLLTIRPGSCPAEVPAGDGGSVDDLGAPSWGTRRGRSLVEYVAAELEDVDIAAADLLVSVGRGVGKQENMDAVRAFADAVGATLACSRPVADKGWLGKSRQVGTSGKVVRPRVYIALGISGAFQHVAGMSGADTIIAVNSDPAAPIFDVAHYGIVADMFEVLPLLQQRFETG